MRRLLLVCAAAGAVSGCGNWITSDTVVEGMIGAGVDDAGRPIVVVNTCDSAANRISIAGARTPGMPADQTNETVAELRSSKPVSGAFTLPLTSGAAGWTTTGQFTLDEGRTYLLDAYDSTKDLQTKSSTVPGSKLKTLKAGQVIVLDGEVWTRAEFDRRACEK